MVIHEGGLFVYWEGRDGGGRKGGGFPGEAVACIVELVDKGGVLCVTSDPDGLEGGKSRACGDSRKEAVPQSAARAAAALPGGEGRFTGAEDDGLVVKEAVHGGGM